MASTTAYCVIILKLACWRFVYWHVFDLALCSLSFKFVSLS